MFEQVSVNPVIEALSRRQVTHGPLVVWLQLASQTQTTAKALAQATGFQRQSVQKFLKLLGHMGLAVVHNQQVLMPDELTSAHAGMLQDIASGVLQVDVQNATLQDETGLELSLEAQMIAKFQGSKTLSASTPGSIVRFPVSGLLYTSNYLVTTTSKLEATELVATTNLGVTTKLVLPYTPTTLERDCKGKPLDTFLQSNSTQNSSDLPDDGPAEIVFNYWKVRCEYPKARLVQGRLRHIRARLREGFTVDEFCKVIDYVAGNAFLRGANSRGRPYDDFSTFARSQTRMQRYLELADLELVNPGDDRAALAASDAPLEVDYL